MKKIKTFKYTGLNGSIFSTVLLEGVANTLLYQLRADEGKVLVKDGEQRSSVLVFPEDVDNWTEIDKNT